MYPKGNFINFLKKRDIELILFLFAVALLFISKNHPFYWDNIVQISFPANWYYDTDFKYFFLPDDMATGHPTFVGMYFALFWKLFGRSLLVSHIAMFPFVFGFTIQLYKLTKNLNIHKNVAIIVLLFLLLDPTILSQLSLITFDVVHLFFYLLCINAILKEKKILLSISFLLLVLTSLRGTISGGGILLFHIFYNYFHDQKNYYSISNYKPYIIGLTGILLFLFSFYYQKGWLIHNSVSNAWKDSAEFASPIEILRNTGIFMWRLIDFGRVVIFIGVMLYTFKIIKTKKFKNESLRTLFLIILGQIIVFYPIIAIYRNPFGHRYLIPIIIPAFILFVIWANQFQLKKIILAGALMLVLSGHFWLYPLKISQGWDATTLHWNYFHVREKMLNYLDKENFKTENIGSFFPNTSPLKYIDLNYNGNLGFKNVNIKEDHLILFSNTFNVEDKIIDSIYNEKEWTMVKEFESNRIYMRLFKKNEKHSKLHKR